MNGIARLGLAIAVATGLTSCGVDDPTGLQETSVAGATLAGDASPLANRGGDPKYVPFKGHFTVMTLALGDPTETCPFVTTHEVHSGVATHLGKTVAHVASCGVEFDEKGLRTTSSSYIESASGGGIYVEADIWFSGPNPNDPIEGTVEVTGGTGRFEGATTPPDEPLALSGILYGLGSGGEYDLTGRISSVGSLNRLAP